MPYRTLDNVIDGVVITFTDITTAKQLERELRATAGQFQSLMDHLRAGYALCAIIPGPDGGVVNGRVVKTNQAFTRMLPGRRRGIRRPDPAGAPAGPGARIENRAFRYTFDRCAQGF